MGIKLHTAHSGAPGEVVGRIFLSRMRDRLFNSRFKAHQTSCKGFLTIRQAPYLKNQSGSVLELDLTLAISCIYAG